MFAHSNLAIGVRRTMRTTTFRVAHASPRVGLGVSPKPSFSEISNCTEDRKSEESPRSRGRRSPTRADACATQDTAPGTRELPREFPSQGIHINQSRPRRWGRSRPWGERLYPLGVGVGLGVEVGVGCGPLLLLLPWL